LAHGAPEDSECEDATGPAILRPADIGLFTSFIQAANSLEVHPEIAENFPSCQENLPEQREKLLLLASQLDFPPLKAQENRWFRNALDGGESIPANISRDEACGRDSLLGELEIRLSRPTERYNAFVRRLNLFVKIHSTLMAELGVYESKQKAKSLLNCVDSEDFFNNDGSVSEEAYDGVVKKCVEETESSELLWKDLETIRASDSIAAGLNCIMDEESAVEVARNMEIAKKVSKALEKTYEKGSAFLATQAKAMPLQLNKVQTLRSKFSKWRCSDWRKGRDTALMKAIPKLHTDSERYGTGFYIRGEKGKTELVTAQHVGFNEGSHQNKNLLSIKGEGTIAIDFPVEPGSYHATGDIIKTKVDSQDSALAVVDSDFHPQLGQTIRISGYPGSRKGEFSTVSCRYLGVGNGSAESEDSKFIGSDREAYFLHCPAVEDKLAGMSGGPAMLDDGKVLGLVGAHSLVNNVVAIMPLGRDEQGKVHIGFQKIFHTPHCYKDLLLSGGPKPCQVIPGLTYETNIP